MINRQQAKAINTAANGKKKVEAIRCTPETTKQALDSLENERGL
jgi:hypothetical protein